MAVWDDALAVDEREVYLTYQVHNEAIAIPENIDAIRALTGFEDAEASTEATNRSLGITTVFLPGTTRPVPHVKEGEHPGLAAVRAAHAGLASVGFKGSEEPTSDDGSEMGDA
ncbi:MAG: hypothetical protein ACRDZM_13485 [Acidimicrobiia bacterium]